MLNKFKPQALVTLLGISGALALTSVAHAQSRPPVGGSTPPAPSGGTLPLPPSGVPNPGLTPPVPSSTVFRCVNYGGEYATVAVRSNGSQTAPMVVWRSHAFGSEYTPAYRCQQVSDKLTQVVASNGGKLSNLWLTTGNVNGQTVVCFVNSAERCNVNNQLFTLKRENARQAGDVLARLVRFGQRGEGAPVFEGENGSTNDQPTYVSLEEVVGAGFESGGSFNSTPEVQPQNVPNTVQPNNTFSQPGGPI